MTIFWPAFGSSLHPPTPPEHCARKRTHFHPFCLKFHFLGGYSWGGGGVRGLFITGKVRTLFTSIAYYEAKGKWLCFNEPWRIWIASWSFDVFNDLFFFLLFYRANIAEGTGAKSRRCLFRIKTRPKTCQPKSTSEINVGGKTVTVTESCTCR